MIVAGRNQILFDKIQAKDEGGLHMALSLYGILLLLVVFLFLVLTIFLVVLIIKALRKYLNSSEVKKEHGILKKSLGETIKEYRTKCKMTQEFVAESLGVSRQAVSKWENGTSEPSTSNLFALAKLFGVSVEELLKGVR